MDAGGARARLIVAGAGVVLGTATWLFATSGGTPPPPDGVTGVALFEPERETDVSGFVAACDIAGEHDVPRLRELARSDSPLVAGRAIAALGRLDRLHDDPKLKDHLDDSRPRVRHETIIALGNGGRDHVIPLLIPILEDEDQQTRYLAISALGQLGAHDALNQLIASPSTDAATRDFARATMTPYTVPEILATTGSLE